jgi:hypothetical protein
MARPKEDVQPPTIKRKRDENAKTHPKSRDDAESHSAKKQKLQTRKYPCPLAEKLGCTCLNHSSIPRPIAESTTLSYTQDRLQSKEVHFFFPASAASNKGSYAISTTREGNTPTGLNPINRSSLGYTIHAHLAALLAKSQLKVTNCTCLTMNFPAQMLNSARMVLLRFLRQIRQILLDLSSDMMGEHSIYSCLGCNEKGLASQFEPTAEERSLGHIGRHGICEICRAFNAGHSMEKKKYVKRKMHWPLSFFKAFKGGSLLRSFKPAKNADNLWKQYSKCRLKAKRNSYSYKLICRVPICREAVSRAPHSPSRMAQHMELYKVRGDLGVLDTYPHRVKHQAPNYYLRISNV